MPEERPVSVEIRVDGELATTWLVEGHTATSLAYALRSANAPSSRVTFERVDRGFTSVVISGSMRSGPVDHTPGSAEPNEPIGRFEARFMQGARRFSSWIEARPLLAGAFIMFCIAGWIATAVLMLELTWNG